jgi:hypothetical protein
MMVEGIGGGVLPDVALYGPSGSCVLVKLFAISGYEKAQTLVGSRLGIWTEESIARCGAAVILP